MSHHSTVPEPPVDIAGPPEEEFWERYNRRLEFPLATVTTILFHVVVGTTLYVAYNYFSGRAEDKSSVPMKMIDFDGGLDDGAGSTGSGGTPDPLARGESNPWKQNPESVLPDPTKLPEIIQDIKTAIKLDDPTDNVSVSPANAAQYQALDEELRKKFLGLGSRKGAGRGDGTGSDGTPGTGPGGPGADSSRARSLRWVLRFRTADGADYVAQLAAMGAVILVPMPPENKECLYFTDLKNPAAKKMATDADVKQLAGQIKFSDTRADSVRGVCEALGVREPARSFWAFFPRGLEDELSTKEKNYRNRRADDIEETVFRVTTRGGNYEIFVDDQTPKR